MSPAIVEPIEDSRNGRLLAQDASIDQWIEVLELLLHDIPQRSQLAQNAKAVRETFSEQRLRESFLGSLEGLSHG